jgi:hypothetical protein
MQIQRFSFEHRNRRTVVLVMYEPWHPACQAAEAEVRVKGIVAVMAGQPAAAVRSDVSSSLLVSTPVACAGRAVGILVDC